LTDYFL